MVVAVVTVEEKGGEVEVVTGAEAEAATEAEATVEAIVAVVATKEEADTNPSLLQPTSVFPMALTATGSD